jgi:hypothetical protein
MLMNRLGLIAYEKEDAMARGQSRKSSAKADLRNLPAKSVSGKQAGSVKGGKSVPKLLEAAIKGKVFKKVEIHGTA